MISGVKGFGCRILIAFESRFLFLVIEVEAGFSFRLPLLLEPDCSNVESLLAKGGDEGAGGFSFGLSLLLEPDCSGVECMIANSGGCVSADGAERTSLVPDFSMDKFFSLSNALIIPFNTFLSN
eukprot:CAMPEP_0117744914 /NCGR_PEP_ID=MMETSP0947-20121206/7046_1 /TAXON_ID=44440 /ORGANISM="Chattonella subsalsa, Strain CCMP2191" /LENGTH=123 /DNA_ID=CAMNT_0005561961 /DNA_START=316 /DNA_END=687 /DNA_ORIENTATION=-